MTVLGGEFALMLLVSGHGTPSASSKVRRRRWRRSSTSCWWPRSPSRASPNRVGAVCRGCGVHGSSGIVHGIAEFFSTRAINIEDLNTWTYAAAHTRHADVLNEHDHQRTGQCQHRPAARRIHPLLRRAERGRHPRALTSLKKYSMRSPPIDPRKLWR